MYNFLLYVLIVCFIGSWNIEVNIVLCGFIAVFYIVTTGVPYMLDSFHQTSILFKKNIIWYKKTQLFFFKYIMGKFIKFADKFVLLLKFSFLLK